MTKESIVGILVRAKDNLIVMETAAGHSAAVRGGWETREVVSQWPESSEYLKPFLRTPRREVMLTVIDGVAKSLNWTVPKSRWKEMEIIVDPYFNIEIARLPNLEKRKKGSRTKKK